MVSGVICISETVWVCAEAAGGDATIAKPPKRDGSSQNGKRAGRRTRAFLADFTGRLIPRVERMGVIIAQERACRIG
jgi:hypothetical protein